MTQIEIEQNRTVAKYKGKHVGQLASIAVSSDGQTVVTAGMKGNFCFYEVDTKDTNHNDEAV